MSRLACVHRWTGACGKEQKRWRRLFGHDNGASSRCQHLCHSAGLLCTLKTEHSTLATRQLASVTAIQLSFFASFALGVWAVPAASTCAGVSGGFASPPKKLEEFHGLHKHTSQVVKRLMQAMGHDIRVSISLSHAYRSRRRMNHHHAQTTCAHASSKVKQSHALAVPDARVNAAPDELAM